MPKKEPDDTYSIRCFLNKQRKLTHELNQKEAECFRAVAQHLVEYLTKEYNIK